MGIYLMDDVLLAEKEQPEKWAAESLSMAQRSDIWDLCDVVKESQKKLRKMAKDPSMDVGPIFER